MAMDKRKTCPKPLVHTPGPWIARKTMSHLAIFGKDGIAVARTPCADAQAIGDAALLAAAPDLLAVAKELVESAAYWSEYDVPPGIVGRLNAAIAKAEGRTS